MIGSIAEYRRLLDAALAPGKVYIHLDARVAGVDLDRRGEVCLGLAPHLLFQEA